MWTNDAGLLPEIIVAHDPQPAKVQIQQRYAHGGGFMPLSGFKLQSWHHDAELLYPGDAPMREVWRIHLPFTNEDVILFQYAFVAVVQADGSFDVVRMD